MKKYIIGKVIKYSMHFLSLFLQKHDFRKVYEGFEACALGVRTIVATMSFILSQTCLVQ